MRLRRYTLSIFLVTSLWSLASVPSVFGQEQFSRDQLITAAREIMTTTRYCALIPAAGAGRTNARTMDAFVPDENMSVWFGTNPVSRKVREIRRNPRVTPY